MELEMLFGSIRVSVNPSQTLTILGYSRVAQVCSAGIYHQQWQPIIDFKDFALNVIFRANLVKHLAITPFDAFVNEKRPPCRKLSWCISSVRQPLIGAGIANICSITRLASRGGGGASENLFGIALRTVE